MTRKNRSNAGAAAGLAVDPVTVVIRECTTLAAAMSKYTKYSSQSASMASLLTRGVKNDEKETQLFNNYRRISSGDYYHSSGTSNANAGGLTSNNNNKHGPSSNNDPLIFGFLQLKAMLSNYDTLDQIDSLTVLQPFLLVVSTSTTSGYVTNLALTSVHKMLFQYHIINEQSLNYNAAIRNVMVSLTHCRFEGSEQMTDDSVLLKVLSLIQCIFTSENGQVLSDSGVYEVLQTVLSLACNKRRSEVLRKAAESTMLEITIKLFTKLRTIAPTKKETYISAENYASKNLLPDDVIGSSKDVHQGSLEPENLNNVEFEHSSLNPKISGSNDGDSPEFGDEETTETKLVEAYVEADFGLAVIKDYLGILISLITPENSLKHNYSTRVLSLQLLNTAIELAGDCFIDHPSLFALASDLVFKNVVFIIKNAKNTKPTLLQSALQTFVTLCLALGDYLESQLEFALKIIFDIVLDKDIDQMTSVVKELLMEHVALLWTRSTPSFFTKLFVIYDCSLDKTDVCVEFIRTLSKLSLPEVAAFTADTVPPLCLDGIITFVDDVYNSLSDVSSTEEYKKTNSFLDQRKRKTSFIESAETFNEKPKKGIQLLVKNGYIADDSDEHVAKFLFENKGRLNKKTVGEYIANPKNIALLKLFISNFAFNGLRVDEAIRVLLTKFRLPGESQQIERIVETFASKYVQDQEYDSSKEGAASAVEGDYSAIQPDADSVFVLSYSIIMLNTDFYNPQVKNHMTFDDYSYNLKGCNNKSDFPLWYLEKTYNSIKDKEIVMPEEHHGNEEWFDDAWNNLITSLVVYNEAKDDTTSKVAELTDPITMLQFDRAIFDLVGSEILDSLFKIFEIASDDYVSATMLSTIDKCCFVASHYGLLSLYNGIIQRLIKISGLTGDKQYSDEAFEIENIPLVEMVSENDEGHETLSVSKYSVTLGKDYKGQLASILLFRILKLNGAENSISENNWAKIVDIVIELFKNKILDPDVFGAFQKKYKLPPLPKPAAEHTIKKSKKINGSKTGFLSSFASYLKGDEEPSIDEINCSSIAVNCLQTCDLDEFWKNGFNFSDGRFMDTLLHKLEDSAKDQEILKLFVMDLVVGSYFEYCSTNMELGDKIIKKLFSVTQNGKYSKAFALRVLVYKMCMLNVVQESALTITLLEKEILVHNEIYDEEFFENKNVGGEFLKKIIELAHLKPSNEKLFHNESFWKVLRKFASFHKHTETVYNFVAVYFLTEGTNCLNSENFMWLLGLLDEISSIGAVGSQWESEYDRLVKTGHKVTKENPYQDIVGLSLKSISTTARLANMKVDGNELSKNEVFALIQALTHQCLNPCYQLRSYALEAMQETLLQKVTNDCLSLIELIDNGLAPLLDNTPDSKLSVLTVLSKCYLHYFEADKADDDSYTRVLEVFNKYISADPDAEVELQRLITEKKNIQEHGKL